MLDGWPRARARTRASGCRPAARVRDHADGWMAGARARAMIHVHVQETITNANRLCGVQVYES